MIGLNAARSSPLPDGLGGDEKKLPDGAQAAAYRLAAQLMDSLLHEARNPLNAISINLEVLAEKLKGEGGAVPPPQEKNLKAIREQIFRTDAVLKRFAEFVAPRVAGPGQAPLSDLVLKAVEILAHESRRRRVRMSQKIEPGLYFACEEISSLKLLFVQALLRSLCRAAPGGQIDVTLERTEAGPRLLVVDHGGPQTEDAEAIKALNALGQASGANLKVSDGGCELIFGGGTIGRAFNRSTGAEL